MATDERARDVSVTAEQRDDDRPTLEFRLRPLTPAERRLLRCKIRRYDVRPREIERRVAWIAAITAGLLWVLTLLASDAPWPVATVIWLVLGVVLYVWVLRDLRKESAPLPAMAASMESALRRDEAESFDIRATAYAEFEEIEDEGACYAFDLGDGRLVFLTGQQFYPSARFPGLDFSVVYPLDEDGASADMWIEKRGPAAEPDRVIPASVKWDLAERILGPLEIVQGSLDTIEERL